MNQLNETIRILRTQIAAEKKQPKTDIEKLKELQKQLDNCLKTIRE